MTYFYSVLWNQNFSERQLDFVKEKHLKTSLSKKSFLENVHVSVCSGKMIPPNIHVPNVSHRCKNVPLCYSFSVHLKRCKSTEKIKISTYFCYKEVSMTLIWFRLLSNWKSWRDNLSPFVLSLRVIQIFQDCAIWLNVLIVTSVDASPYIPRSKEWPNGNKDGAGIS